MSKSKIEWTDEVWNPVTGCNKVSAGCKNCYAETMHRRLQKMYPEKYTAAFSYRVEMHISALPLPSKWKKPRKVFVNSMSDLFHENVSFEFINAVFSVMSDCDHHTYQVLTKRPARMLEFFEWKKNQHGIEWQAKPNVWIGVSVENQKTADERIPLLLKVPAAVRFLSCEPLLGPISILEPFQKESSAPFFIWPGQLHWVIVGGESGPGARPMHPDWVRSLQRQCAQKEVPFFFKQWGAWAPDICIRNTEELIADDARILPKGEVQMLLPNGEHDDNIFSRGGIDQPVTRMIKVGKKKAGHLLDGNEYLEMPLTTGNPQL